MCLILEAHLNLNAKSSSEIRDPYLDSIRFTAIKVQPYVQDAPLLLKSVLITGLGTQF